MVTTAASSVTSSKSLFALVADACVEVQIVILILIMASVWSWAIIIGKYLAFKRIKARTREFERVFAVDRIDLIFEKLKNSDFKRLAPIQVIFVSMVSELKKHTAGKTHLSIDEQHKIKNKLDAIFANSRSQQIHSLEKYLGDLATVSSVSPFIGLFGTVWGIMDSFQAISVSKNTSLAVVAPGIAEALLATAIGLIAAIPALIFYNTLTTMISEVETDTDNFSTTLNAAFLQVLEGYGNKTQ